MSNRTRRAAAVALLLIAVPAMVVIGQGFGDPRGFGESSSSRTYETERAPASSGTSSYFLHDQLTKLLLVVGFTALGLIIVLTRRFRLRTVLLVASVAGLGFAIGGVLCPMSAVQNVILKASTGYSLLFLIPTVIAFFFGRLFCGYVCPFGALQELLHIRTLRARIPERALRWLRLLPYALLAYLVVRVLVTGILTLDGMTPFKALFTFGGTPVALAVSAAFVVASVFVFRPFCTLLCPLGAWLSLISRIGPFRMRSRDACVHCRRCDAVCGAQAIHSGAVDRSQCLLCGECIRACPVDALCFAHTRKDRADVERTSPEGPAD